VLGWGTAPQQSLAVFGVLVPLLLADVLQSRQAGGGRWLVGAGALVLGGLLAWASWSSNPSYPLSEKAYESATPEICRPPRSR
jgi:hypothetical protein